MNSSNNNLVVSGTYLNTLFVHNNSNNNTFYFQYNFHLASFVNNNSSLVFSILCTNHYKTLFNPYFFQNYLAFTATTLQILTSYILVFRRKNLVPHPFLFSINQRTKDSFTLAKKALRKKQKFPNSLQQSFKKSRHLKTTKKSLINKDSNREIHVYSHVKRQKRTKSLSALLPWRQYFKFLSKRREKLFTFYVFKAKRYKKFSGLSYRRVVKKFRSTKKPNNSQKGRKHPLLTHSYKLKRFRSRIKLYTTLEQYAWLSREDSSSTIDETPLIKTQYTFNNSFASFHEAFFKNKYKILTPLLRASPRKFDIISQPLNVTKHTNWRHFNNTKKARKRIVFLTLVSKLKRKIKILSYLTSPKFSIGKSIKLRRQKLITNKRRKYSLPRQYHFLNGPKPSFMKFRPMKTVLFKRMIRFYKRHLIKIKNVALKGPERRKNYKYTWKKRALLKRSRKDLSRLLPRLEWNNRMLPIKKLAKVFTSQFYLRKRFLNLYMKNKFKIFSRENNHITLSRNNAFALKLKFKKLYLTRTKLRYLTRTKRRIYRWLRKTSIKYMFSTSYYTRKRSNTLQDNPLNILRFGKNILFFPLQPSITSYKLPRRLGYYRQYKKVRLLRRVVSINHIRVRTKSLFSSSKSIPKFLNREQFRKKRRLERELRMQARKKTSIFGITMEELIKKEKAAEEKKRLDKATKLSLLIKPHLPSLINTVTKRHILHKLRFIFRRFREQLLSLPLRGEYRMKRKLQRQAAKAAKASKYPKVVVKSKLKTTSNIITESQPIALFLSQPKIQTLVKPRFNPVRNSKHSIKFKVKSIEATKEVLKPSVLPKVPKLSNKAKTWYKFLLYLLYFTNSKSSFNKFSTFSWKRLQVIFLNITNPHSKRIKITKSEISNYIEVRLLNFLKKINKTTSYIKKNPQVKRICQPSLNHWRITIKTKEKAQIVIKPNKLAVVSTSISNPLSSQFFSLWKTKNPRVKTNLSSKVHIHSNHLKSGLFLLSRYKSPFILSHYGFLFIQTTRTPKTQLLAAKINKHRYSFFYKNDIKKFYLRNTGRLKLLKSMINRSNNFFYSSPSLNWHSLSQTTNSVTKLLTLPKENSIATGAMVRSSIGFDLINARQQLFVNPLMRKPAPDNYNVSIKRIKFKPGYSRIWRRSREAINFSLHLHLRYQYRLTRCLNRLQRTTKGESSRLYELTLLRLLVNARFVLDLSSSSLMLQNHLVFVNGSQCSNPNLYLFKGDFIQLAVSLKYYIVYRWLYNYNFQHKLRLHKLSKSKSNKSRTDLSKQKSSHLPDWIFLVGYRHFDIPRYMEVDYFTLSAFILYDHILLTDYNPLTFLESRNEILNMYNWKYTV